MISELHTAVVWTARAAAIAFAAALALPALFSLPACRRDELTTSFLIALTVHFAVVAWFAIATGGGDLFPGGRSLSDAGGWPALVGVAALTYTLAFVGFGTRRAPTTIPTWLRASGAVSRLLLGAMFIATYLGLLPRSAWYALPLSMIALSLLLDACPWRIVGCPALRA